MATVNQIKIIVEAEDKASAPIERATKSTRNLGRASREVTKESKKDWGGLADLFGGVLPRNLQSLQRGFKGTQRQVGRLSKSFKILKTAWASVGIGLAIIAIEQLINNWDTLTEKIGVSSKARSEQAEVTQKANEEAVQVTDSLIAKQTTYLAVLEDQYATDQQKAIALDSLNETLNGMIDTEADLATQRLQANEGFELTKRLRKAEIREAAALKNVEIALQAQRENASVWMESASARKIRLEAEVIKAQQRSISTAETLTYETARYDNAVKAVTKTIDDRAKAEADATKSTEQIRRDAEAKKKKSEQDAAANAEWLANQRIDLAKETELRLIQDEEKRDLRSLEMQHETAKAELALRGGTLTDKLELEQSYLLDRAEIEGEYQQQRDDKADEEDIKEAARVETLRSALATDQENEIVAMTEHYAGLLAIAEVDSQEYIDLEQRQKDALDKINGDYNDRTRADDAKTQSMKMQGAIKMANATRNILGSLGDMAEEGSKRQQNLAIVDVLLAQAISIANAIAGATKAGMGTGTAAPLTTPIFIAQMVGSVLASFAGVKSILNKAGAAGSMGGSSGGGGGGGRGGFAPVSTQVPLPARLDSTDMQAYVVQSQLQGQINAQHRLNGQIVL